MTDVAHYAVELEDKTVSDEGVIEGYGAIFGNIDRGNDVIKRGAFAKTLRNRARVPMLFGHNQQRPVGMWDRLVEDGKGLRVRGRFNLDTQDGREAFSNAKMGAISGLSIGYKATEAEWISKAGGAIRELREVDLREVSLVTIPMNEQAVVTAVKDAEGAAPDAHPALIDALGDLEVKMALAALEASLTRARRALF